MGQSSTGAEADCERDATAVTDAPSPGPQELQRLATLGSFARGVGHELNNLEAVLSCAVDDLARTRAVTDEVLEDVQLATRHLEALAGALMRLSSPSQPEAEIDVCTVVRDAVALLKLTGQAKYLTLRVELPPAPVLARLSPSQAQQVVVGLLVRSIATASKRSDGLIQLALSSEQGQVHLRVEDNAPPASAPAPGAGLELVQALVKGWGGQLELAHRPGEGGLADLRFPSEPPG